MAKKDTSQVLLKEGCGLLRSPARTGIYDLVKVVLERPHACRRSLTASGMIAASAAVDSLSRIYMNQAPRAISASSVPRLWSHSCE